MNGRIVSILISLLAIVSLSSQYDDSGYTTNGIRRRKPYAQYQSPTNEEWKAIMTDTSTEGSSGASGGKKADGVDETSRNDGSNGATGSDGADGRSYNSSTGATDSMEKKVYQVYDQGVWVTTTEGRAPTPHPMTIVTATPTPKPKSTPLTTVEDLMKLGMEEQSMIEKLLEEIRMVEKLQLQLLAQMNPSSSQS